MTKTMNGWKYQKTTSELPKQQRSQRIVYKTIVRTITYQFLLIFIGLSIGFLISPVYWGNRASIITRSIENIFYPLEYSEELELYLMDFGKSRLWVVLDCPEALTCYNSKIVNEEWYETDYSFEDKEKKIIEGHYRTRIRWKSWEFYYPSPEDLEIFLE